MRSDERTQELRVRTRWAIGRITECINQGRSDGWLQGAPIASVPAIEAPADDSGTTPMRELAARLDLTEQEVDALWLLACIELDPLAACCAQHLFILNANALSVQMLERLVPLGQKSLGRLVQLALVDFLSDTRQPLFRRTVRVNDIERRVR